MKDCGLFVGEAMPEAENLVEKMDSYVAADAEYNSAKAELDEVLKRQEEVASEYLKSKEGCADIVAAYNAERDRYDSDSNAYREGVIQKRNDEALFADYKNTLRLDEDYRKRGGKPPKREAVKDPSKIKYPAPAKPMDEAIVGPYRELLQKWANLSMEMKSLNVREGALHERIDYLFRALDDASGELTEAGSDFAQRVKNVRNERARAASFREHQRRNTIAYARGMVQQGAAVLRQMGEKV